MDAALVALLDENLLDATREFARWQMGAVCVEGDILAGRPKPPAVARATDAALTRRVRRGPRPERPRFGPHAAAAAVVFAAAVALYANTLANGLVFDDVHKITEDLRLRRFEVRELFTTNYWGAYSPGDALYRPLVNLTYAVDYAFSGLDPAPYHAVNVLLHGLNCVLVLLLALRLFGDVRPAGAAALAFAAHPIHTEAVANVVGRAELLCFALSLVSLLAFLRARERGAALWWSVCAASYFMALLSKETAVLLPALFLLWELTIARRRPRRPWGYIALLAAFAVVLLIRKGVTGAFLTANAGGLPAPDPLDRAFPLAHLDPEARVLTALSTLGRDLWLLLFPARLCADYSFAAIPEAHAFTAPGVPAGIGAALVVIAGAVIAFARSPIAFWCVAVFVLMLLPISNFVFPVGTILAERLLYFPSLGFCLLLGTLLVHVGTRGTRARVVWAAFALLLVLYGARTVLRNPVWREEERFWADTVDDCPGNAKALYNHGKRMMERWIASGATAGGDALLGDRARERFVAALAIDPQLFRAHLNIGVIHSLRQEHDRSAQQYRLAAAVAPAAHEPWVNLGYDYAFRGEAAASAGNAGEARTLREQAVASFLAAEQRMQNQPALRATLEQVRATRTTIERALR